MSQHVNFGDPAFEPTDEQLRELAREAFAEVAENHRAALARLRVEIARLRVEATVRVSDDETTARGL